MGDDQGGSTTFGRLETGIFPRPLPREDGARIGRLMPSAYRQILVGFTADRGAVAALELAGRLAQRHGARLTIVAATAPSAGMLLSPQGAAAWLMLTGELADSLRSPMRALPADVGVTHAIIGGALARALAQAMRDEPFDLLVLSASAARKRAMRRLVWRSSVALCVADAPRGQSESWRRRDERDREEAELQVERHAAP